MWNVPQIKFIFITVVAAIIIIIVIDYKLLILL